MIHTVFQRNDPGLGQRIKCEESKGLEPSRESAAGVEVRQEGDLSHRSGHGDENKLCTWERNKMFS